MEIKALDIDGLFSFGESVLNRFWPDKEKRAEQIYRLEQLRQEGDLTRLQAEVGLLMEQVKVNAESAKHPSVFVAGARPFVIWVGGFSLAWAGLIHPLLMWVWAFVGMEGAPPPLVGTEALMTILGGLLGIGGLRTYEKQKGVATTHLQSKEDRIFGGIKSAD